MEFSDCKSDGAWDPQAVQDESGLISVLDRSMNSLPATRPDTRQDAELNREKC